jgi:hypothetical protein
MNILTNFLRRIKFLSDKDKLYLYKILKKNNGFDLNKYSTKKIEYSFGLNKSDYLTEPKLKFVSRKRFESITKLWEFITQNKKWYLEYRPSQIKNIESYIEEIVPLIVKTTNELRRKIEFSNNENFIIAEWDNLVLRHKEKSELLLKESKKLTTYCSNCGIEMGLGLNQRYPKSICGICSKEVTDIDERNVEFYNTQIGGNGCQGYYSGTGQKEKYDSNLCYINGKEFYAEEARFGGIVIQLKE